MIRSISRFRAFLVAVAVLALTAGAALAGHSALSTPAAAAGGLERAAEAAGKLVPVAVPLDESNEDADEDANEEEPATDEPAADEPSDPAGAEHPDNHGKTVSEAATGETPADFDNHGEYVRSVATDNHGQDVAAEHEAGAAAAATKGKPGH